MSYQVTRIFDTAEEAIAFLEANDNAKPAAKKKPAVVEDDDEPKPKARKKPAATEDDDEPAPKKKAAKSDELDYETDIRPLVVGLSKDHGRDVALEILEQFTNPSTDEPCTKGAEVDPADWKKLISKIEKKRAALED